MKCHSKYYNITSMILFMLGLFLTISTSCRRQDDWLDVKRNLNDVVPATLKDFQAVLDQNKVMNTYYPIMCLLGTDNSYVTDADLSSATLAERNSYIWAKDVFQGQASDDWSACYTMVEYSNIVLDGLEKVDINSSNTTDYNNVKGSALFYRAMAFYNLSQVFCKPYQAATANTDLGIPLRLSSDINIPSRRSTLQETYDKIISDLNTALPLLPISPLYSTRPSQAAANALLARAYLAKEDYTSAGTFANNCLLSKNALLDFNSSLVTPSSTYRFPGFTTGNPEIILFADATGYKTLWAVTSGTGNIDTTLYKLYAVNDLRRTLFFKDNGGGKIKFQGTYAADGYNFGGIATNEVYLIRAECYARAGNTSAAMSDLNTLLSKRWKSGTFVPYTAINSSDALGQILQERRKELPFTAMIRWEDLRRLNKDPRFSVAVTHVYNGVTYTLPPNDKRYVYPIPDLDVQLYNLQQNDR